MHVALLIPLFLHLVFLYKGKEQKLHHITLFQHTISPSTFSVPFELHWYIQTRTTNCLDFIRFVTKHFERKMLVPVLYTSI